MLQHEIFLHIFLLLINLLRAGFDNALAIEGAKIDDAVVIVTKLCRAPFDKRLAKVRIC